MSTIYMSRQLSTLPLMEMEVEQDRAGLFPSPFHVAKDPPILFPFMITNPVDHQLQGQSSSYGDQHLRPQHVLSESTQQFTDRMMMSGSQVFPTRSSPFQQTIQSIDGDMIQRSAYDSYGMENNKHTDVNEGLCSGGWTVSSSPPAKMKIMRRKATSKYPEGSGAARKPRRRPQAHHQDAESQLLQQQQHAIGVVRVCSDCNTTKTPLWRSGPCGPKSLCNACGIRQRKARRAMAAAAAAAASNGGDPEAATQQKPKPAKKEKRSDVVDRSSLPFKKRCKTMVVVDHAAAGAATEAAATTTMPPGTAAPTKDQADHHVSSDKQVNGHAAPTNGQSKIVASPPQAISSSSFHAFPADEITDAAMLLMTLSCGLARPQLAMASS